MFDDVAVPRPRRALLAGFGAAAAAFVAHAVGRATPARAAVGDPLILGQENTSARATTRLLGNPIDEGLLVLDTSGPDGGTALKAIATDDAIKANSIHGYALQAGSGMGTAILAGGLATGLSARGIDNAGVFARGGNMGVHAYSEEGSAVLAESGRDGRYAIDARGSLKFSSAGVATIHAGAKSVLVALTAPVRLSGRSIVLATLQVSAGGTTSVHRVVRSMANNTIRIYLTRAATQECKVAWFLLDW